MVDAETSVNYYDDCSVLSAEYRHISLYDCLYYVNANPTVTGEEIVSMSGIKHDENRNIDDVLSGQLKK